MSKKKKTKTQKQVSQVVPTGPVIADNVVQVEVDGVIVVFDPNPLTDLRLLRRLNRNDVLAVVEMYERVFPDQLDDLEIRFDLRHADDYAGFAQRCIGLMHPN